MKTIQECADLYMHGADHPVTEPELAKLRGFIAVQYRQIRCPIVYVDQDVSLPECNDCLQSEGILYISIANNYHPYLTPGENAQFRAVHDFHHLLIDADSTFAGECAVYSHATKMAPKSIRWILFSEIVLQAAACISTGEFQPQKMVKVGGF